MKTMKKILLGVTLLVTVSMLTACGCGNGNENNAADEVPIVDDNTTIDETEPKVTDVPEDEKEKGTSQDSHMNGTSDKYGDTKEYDANESADDKKQENDRDNNLENETASPSDTETPADKEENNDGTVSGELGNSVEDLGEGVGDAVRDVGDAVGNALNGDDANNTNNTNR